MCVCVDTVSVVNPDRVIETAFSLTTGGRVGTSVTGSVVSMVTIAASNRNGDHLYFIAT